jgi:hypothetical protein
MMKSGMAVGSIAAERRRGKKRAVPPWAVGEKLYKPPDMA